MRGTWGGKRYWSVLLLLAAGCWTTKPSIKPPPHPEEFIKPPESDSRFSAPMAYPKEALKEQPLKKNGTDMPGGPLGTPPQFGTGAGPRGF